MELNQLYTGVLLFILVGMLVGVGVLTLDKFKAASFSNIAITNDSFVVPANMTAVAVGNQNWTGLNQIYNSSLDVLAATKYTVVLNNGSVTMNNNESECKTGDTCYADYKYDRYSKKVNAATTAGRDAVDGVSTSWLALIITIFILAVILTLVLTSFGGDRR